MMMKMKNTKKSFKGLSETIYSLLGFRNETNSTWANTVCDIIKSLPSTADYQNDNGYDDDSAHDLDEFLISNIHGELATLNEEVCRLNAQRRQVLNEFLQLKGNIRVFCRIRPTLTGEKFHDQRPVVPVDSSGILVNFAENKRKLYNFDKVLHPGSTQDEVFSEIEPVIKSALDGYNVCILAYGQTGTGKTFTMEGNLDCPGVVPRTIEALFKQAADSNHTYLFSFSMLEIYLGQLKDLLIPHARKPTDPMPPCLSIQTDPNGGIVIDNLVAIQVSNFNHAISLYRLGSQLRSTASTNSNKVSSRSHCMIRVSMTCSDATERRKTTNKIWMVDLGGSERVLKTKALGRRFEEGKAINLSLSALGDVINALQRKSSHIPYRNSKLTQVLKDSLGEDSKTLMLVHVSPKEEDLCETVCSLNFALRLTSIHLGKTEPNEARAMREIAMTNLQNEMQEIENNRDRLIKEIKKLNQQLDSLTKPSPGSNQRPDSLLSPSSSSSKLPQHADKITLNPQSSKIPSFMKPTICSTRKSGTSTQNWYKKDIKPARRKQIPLSRAESVTFPLKNMTESYSGSSISRASCLLHLNEIQSRIDDELDTSSINESETNTWIRLHENKPMKKRNPKKNQMKTRPADVKFAGDDYNSTIPSIASTKSVTGVDDELDTSSFNESETNTWIRLHENKPVLSNVTSAKKRNPKKNQMKSRPADVKFAGRDYNSTIPSIASTKSVTGVDDELDISSMNESETSTWIRLHENKQILSNPIRETKRNPKKNQMKPRPADVKFAGRDYKSTIPSIGSTKSVTGVNDSSTECDVYRRIMPCDSDSDIVGETCHRYDDECGVDWRVGSGVSVREAWNLEVCELEDDLPATISGMDEVVVEDLRKECSEQCENAQNRGSGIKSLGVDHHFFGALMN